MLDLHAALVAFAATLALAAITWVASAVRHDVSIVDSAWSMLFVLSAGVYAVAAGTPLTTLRNVLVLTLLTAWAIRLCVHITARNYGQGEDRRYQAIRARNEPGFAWKSLYLVFGLQAVLASIVVTSVHVALGDARPFGGLDAIGLLIGLAGLVIETVADVQLARFRADPRNRGRVLDTGLWRYSRHPNYFGEATLWWGLFVVTAAGGGGWTVFSPLLMTFLLLRVSGVALLEQDIGERRPAYADYIARTPAFFPWRPKPASPDPAAR
jgi:steroid 5-alpha reductase family enzyme